MAVEILAFEILALEILAIEILALEILALKILAHMFWHNGFFSPATITLAADKFNVLINALTSI